MANQMVCRRATVEDYQAVLAILEIYQGRDYMPSWYNHMMCDPSYIGVLGQLNGETVAYTGAYIINNGSTMMTKGSRVKKELQGRGLYRQIRKYLQEELSKRDPNLKLEEYATNRFNPIFLLPKAQQKYKELDKRPVKAYGIPDSFKADTKDCAKLLVDARTRVEPLSLDGLREVLSDEILCKFLFPNRLTVNWHVYMPMASNVDIIAHNGMYIMRSVVTESDKRTSCMTFGTWFQTSRFLEYTVDCYVGAGTTPGPAELTAHIKNHATKALEMTSNGKASLAIFASSAILLAVDAVSKTIGLNSISFHVPEMIIVSREL